MLNVEITLLGQFGIRIDERPLLLPAKGIELIAYLTLQPRRCASVDQLLGALWPDFTIARALGNLNTTVWRTRAVLRKASAPDIVIRTRGDIALDLTKVHVDIWKFEECTAAVNSGHLSPSSAAEAVALFKGELLEGDFDTEWLPVERERIRRLYLTALRTHASCQATSGKISEALRDYRLAVEKDPLNEELSREMMRVCYANGKRTEALLVFATLAKRLRLELQVEPESETVRLSEAIRNQKLVSPNGGKSTIGVGSEIELIGREANLHELNEVLTCAMAGTCLCIGVEGEMGIGKTRLVREFSRLAELKGCKVIFCRNAEGSTQTPPYSLLQGLLANSQRDFTVSELPFSERDFAISAIVDAQSRGEKSAENSSQVRFLEILASWLKDHGGSHPLILVVEDVQFSDLPSLKLILSITRRLRNEKMLVLLTWRGEDCPDRVSALLRSDREVLKTLRLSRLSLADVRVLCRAYFRPISPSERVVSYVYEESEGNPLFAIECLKSLGTSEGRISQGTLSLTKSHPKSVPGYGSESIRTRVLTRVERLPECVKRVVRVASGIGREIQPYLVAKVLRLSLGTTLDRLEILRSAGLITIKGEAFEFVHDKIRELCYEDIPVRERTRIHQRTLEVLEATFPDRLDALAFHSERARNPRSVSYWERLGDRAVGLWAHSEACEAYTSALASLEMYGHNTARNDRFTLLKKRLLTWECLGDLEKAEIDARAMYILATEAEDELKKCETFLVDSRLLLRQGLFNRALDRAHLAIEIARRLCDSSLEVESREIASLTMLRLHEYSRAEVELSEVIRILGRLNDVNGLERAWTSLARIHVVQGHHLRTIECLTTAERHSTGNLSQASTRAVIRGVARGFLGRGRDALADLRAASWGFHKVGNLSGRAVANSWLAQFSLCDGDVANAVTYARRALPFIAARSEVRWGLISASVLSYGFWCVVGNFKRAEREIARAWKDAETKGNPGHFLDTAACIALERNDATGALSIAERAVEHFSGRSEAGLADVLTTLGRIYLALARPQDAAGALQRAVNLQESAGELLMLPRGLSFLAIAQMENGSNHGRFGVFP